MAFVLRLVPSGDAFLVGLALHLDLGRLRPRFFSLLRLVLLQLLLVHQILQHVRAGSATRCCLCCVQGHVPILFKEDCESRIPVEAFRAEVKMAALVHNLHLFWLEHNAKVFERGLLILRKMSG